MHFSRTAATWKSHKRSFSNTVPIYSVKILSQVHFEFVRLYTIQSPNVSNLNIGLSAEVLMVFLARLKDQKFCAILDGMSDPVIEEIPHYGFGGLKSASEKGKK